MVVRVHGLRPTRVSGAVGEQQAELFVGRDRTGGGELSAYRVAHCHGGFLGLRGVASGLVRRLVHLAMPHSTAFFLPELGNHVVHSQLRQCSSVSGGSRRAGIPAHQRLMLAGGRRSCAARRVMSWSAGRLGRRRG